LIYVLISVLKLIITEYCQNQNPRAAVSAIAALLLQRPGKTRIYRGEKQIQDKKTRPKGTRLPVRKKILLSEQKQIKNFKQDISILQRVTPIYCLHFIFPVVK